MEIFQTIWTALTNENETLSLLLCSPLMFLEVYLSMCMFCQILNIDTSKINKILYVIILSSIGLLTIWLIPNPYNTFFNILACPILVFICFKPTILKSILAEIIPYILFLLVSIPLMLLFSILFSNSNFLYIPMLKILYSLYLYLFITDILIILKKFDINIMHININKISKKCLLIINFIIGIICIAIQCYIVTLYYNILPFCVILINIMALAIYFSFSMFALIRTSKLETTTQSLEEEKLYNKTLTILYDNIRGFKHDFNNIVQAIGGYISSDNINGLKEYYSDLLEDCQKSNNLSILNPELINNSAIYSLLTSKYYKADNLGVKINLELFLDLSTLNVKIYQFTRILGILLDNAIEAASQCENKIINITVRKDSKVNRKLFVIENTYSNKSINLDKIFEKGYTSKSSEDKENHGIGLWEVRQILSKNTNLNLFTTKNEKFFKQQLEIY